MNDSEPGYMYQKAKELYNAKRYQEALPLLAGLRRYDDFQLRADTNIGGCLLHMGLIRPGLKFIERALSQDADFLPALINRAEALLAIGNPHQALEIYEDLAGKHPENSSCKFGLAKSYHSTNQDSKALKVIEGLLVDEPSHVAAILMKGEIQSDLHDNANAIRSFGTVLQYEPKNSRAFSNLGVVMMRQNDMEIALRYLDKAIVIAPDSVSDLLRKALIHYSLSDIRNARQCFESAYKLDKSSASLFLSQYLLIPSIPSSATEIEVSRTSFLSGLELAEKSVSSLALDPQAESVPHLFFLAYHNRNDRAIIERYIDLMRELSKSFLPKQDALSLPAARSTQSKSGRIKIGFLSGYFSTHSNCFAFEGLIQNMDRKIFEIYLIHTVISTKDSTRDRLDSVCDHSVQLSNNLCEINSCLRSLQLDILYFTDLGMNAYDFLIPFLKTAPIQITGWGIPHTSGIKEIDYYISCEGLEPDQASDLYTEQLVMLPGGIPCCFLDESLNLTPLPREYFILPPEGGLVGCLQSLHKLHPDFDYALEEIARRNPDIGFVFVEDRLPSRTHRFLERLATNAPSVHERMITYSLMKRAEYHSLCNCIDLLLDPFYYGSGITFFEASFVGTPIVTLEGRFLRSRVVASGYREMGLQTPPIATSIEEYIELTTDLIKNNAKRLSLRSEILQNKYRIFNRIDYVRNFEKFCLQAIKDI